MHDIQLCWSIEINDLQLHWSIEVNDMQVRMLEHWSE